MAACGDLRFKQVVAEDILFLAMHWAFTFTVVTKDVGLLAKLVGHHSAKKDIRHCE